MIKAGTRCCGNHSCGGLPSDLSVFISNSAKPKEILCQVSQVSVLFLGALSHTLSKAALNTSSSESTKYWQGGTANSSIYTVQ